jgi:hypothetical protein
LLPSHLLYHVTPALYSNIVSRELDAAAFSKTLSDIVNRALGSSGYSSGNTPIDSSECITSHPLYVHQESLFSFSTSLLHSVKSLQGTITEIVNVNDFDLGEGWAGDGDDAVNLLIEEQKEALADVQAMIGVKTGKEGIGREEDDEFEELIWKNAVRRCEKGIERLLKTMKLPSTEIEE